MSLFRNPEARAQVAARLAWLRQAAEQIVIDGDAHISDLSTLDAVTADRVRCGNYYHGRPLSAEQLIAEMDISGVTAALVWQNPAVTLRGENREANFAALLAANKYVAEAARRYPQRLIPGGWTDPAGVGLQGALDIVEICVRELGFSIVKLNPAQNRFRIDSDEALRVTERICRLGAIPAFHVGGDTPFTPAAGLAKVAKHIAPHRCIAIHMGGGGSGYVEGESLYHDIRALGLEQPNLFFVQSAKRDCHIESDFITYQTAGRPFCDNIAVGSDAPYGRVSWNFGGYRAMFASLKHPLHPDPRVQARPGLFTDAAIQGYMGRNLARLVISSLEAIQSDRA